ncbi:MAG: hypothetical protein Kow0063_02870 [Anaerolineae bacterium]
MSVDTLMSIWREDPTLSPEHLKRVLDAARAARPIPATPLRAFEIVRQRLLDPSEAVGGAATDYLLIEWLAEQIVEGLCRHRRHYHLAPPRPTCALEQALTEMAADFRQGAGELEAWSLLYYRYVRVDLNLSWDQLEAVTLQDSRTLRRRQQHGLRRLTHQLLRRERRARLAHRKDRLRRALPPSPDYELVGRAELAEQAWQVLTGRGRRRHLALVGPGGIGKTALAASLAHRLLETVELDGVAWLGPLSSVAVQEVAAQFAGALGLFPASPEVLRAYCQARDALLVLDGVDHFVADRVPDGGGVCAFLDVVADARVMVTSRIWVDCPGLAQFHLTELDEQESRAVMARVWPGRWPLDSAREQAIRQQAGGNPLALEVATRLAARLPKSALVKPGVFQQMPAQAALLEKLYEQAWQELGTAERQLWLAAWLLPATGAPQELLVLASGLPVVQVTQAVQRLCQLSLLVFDPASERYTLHGVARAYLHRKVSEQPCLGWASEGALRLRGAVARSPHAAQIAFRLLEVADLLSLPLGERVDLIRAAWPQIAHQGLWTAWLPVLQDQVAAARNAANGPALPPLLRWLGVACRWLGRYEMAEKSLLEALQIADELKESGEHAQALIELAVVYRYQGRFQPARAMVQRALVEFQKRGDDGAGERCLLELAQLALEHGQPEDAIEQLKRLPGSARSAALICEAYLMMGHLQQALVQAERAVALAAGDRPNFARAQATIGRVYLALGRLVEAEDHLSLAVSLLEQGRDMLGWARATNSLAQVYQLQGRLDAALALVEDAAEQQRLLKDEAGLMATLRAQIELYLSLTERAWAAGEAERAAELAERMQRIDAEWRALNAKLTGRAS